ncbi:hypothetical protein COCNU_10G007360 [Cocos nucifera]|uniref:Uncharacterized protein n=1 Tax=Cocos nucifera TaxID=13894 RepID=A0A8K0N8I2_COCNU|nr:hypothetical protein COCNU_10G007360 [Cocos nucifera]
MTRAWPREIWRASTRAGASTRPGHIEDRPMSFSRRGPRVRVLSEKMSLGMGRRSCSKGSRWRWRRRGALAPAPDSRGGVVGVERSCPSSLIPTSSSFLWLAA